MSKKQIFNLKKGKNSEWATTEDSNSYRWVFNTTITCQIYGIQKIQSDAVYPVISILIMWERGEKRPSEYIKKAFGGEFKKHDKWAGTNYHYEVWSHENPYTATEGMRVIQANMDRYFENIYLDMWELK